MCTYFTFTARTRETNSKYSGSNEGNSLVQKKEDISFTGKSLSEAFILTSTNPQYDKRLFIDLQVQYMKTKSSEHVVPTKCFLF